MKSNDKGFCSSGSETVDRMGKINITGNIINPNWLKAITFDNGKPNLKAIVILSDIVYWYRPTEVRDEQTGLVVGYKRKFKADKLQRSYQDFSDLFGITKREATSAIDSLVNAGVVNREFRTITVNGMKLPNVMYLGLNIDVLYRITFPENNTSKQVGEKETSLDISENSDEGGITLESDISHSDMDKNGGITLKSDMYCDRKGDDNTVGCNVVSHSNVIGLASDSGTNTKNTTEITTRNYTINQSRENDGQMDVHSFEFIILSEDEVISETDCNNVIYNMNKTIPYELAVEKQEIKKVIQVLVGWNHRKYLFVDYPSNMHSIMDSSFVLATECLIEMATERVAKKYGGSLASYKNVIDQINKCWKENVGDEPLALLLQMTVERYVVANGEKNIKNPKGYLKTLLWNSFSTYKNDWERYFAREEYGKLYVN